MTAPELLKLVCWFYRLDKEMITSKVRVYELVRAREAFVVVCREDKHMTYSSIARALHKHHTTIISAYKRAKKRQRNNAAFYSEVEFIRNSLRCSPQGTSVDYVQ